MPPPALPTRALPGNWLSSTLVIGLGCIASLLIIAMFLAGYLALFHLCRALIRCIHPRNHQNQQESYALDIEASPRFTAGSRPMKVLVPVNQVDDDDDEDTGSYYDDEDEWELQSLH